MHAPTGMLTGAKLLQRQKTQHHSMYPFVKYRLRHDPDTGAALTSLVAVFTMFTNPEYAIIEHEHLSQPGHAGALDE